MTRTPSRASFEALGDEMNRTLGCSRSAGSTRPAGATRMNSSEQRKLAGLYVLLVEDDRDALAFADRLLREHGALVTGVHDAEQALSFFHHVTPDVIVADIALPGIDGCEMIAQ